MPQNIPWEAIVSATLALIGLIVWLVRLEGKINVLTEKSRNDRASFDLHVAGNTETFKSFGDRFDLLKASLADIGKTLGRIEMFMEQHEKHD